MSLSDFSVRAIIIADFKENVEFSRKTFPFSYAHMISIWILTEMV